MKTGDIVIGVFVVLVGLLLIFCQAGNVRADTVEIYSDGNLFGRYDLFSDTTVDVMSKNGNNIVCISNGYVFVTHSTCEDKNEILQGKISQTGQTLVCLPNKLVVTIKGRGDNVDDISY